jgi:DNA modification methylase
VSVATVQGDAAHLPLADGTVDLIVTSPPYFGLRSYTDGGIHYAGQVGDEPTPAEYLDALTACTREWMRVLKPGGSLFVNLGDKYSTYVANRGTSGTGLQNPTDAKFQTRPSGSGLDAPGIRYKSLVGLPWRYAIRCIDQLGLILRAEIIWSKPNGLPESVTDRVRRSHEQVFHLVKSPRYYTAVDEIREARQLVSGGQTSAANPLGKLPGSVWTIPTSPLRVPEQFGIDHFAAYPPELVRRIILGWSPREVCCSLRGRPTAQLWITPHARRLNCR